MIGYTIGATLLYDKTEDPVSHKDTGGSIFCTFQSVISTYILNKGILLLNDGIESPMGFYFLEYDHTHLGEKLPSPPDHYYLTKPAKIVGKLKVNSLLYKESHLALPFCYYAILKDPKILQNMFEVVEYDTGATHPLASSSLIQMLEGPERDFFLVR